MADSLKARLRHLANRVLNPLGLHLVRTSRAFEMDGLLQRAAARSTPIRTWIDVGASDGSWSLMARRHFPKARNVLFEPLAERQAALEGLRGSLGFVPIMAAAGAERGSIAFAIDDALDGSGVAAPGSERTRSVPVRTVDEVIVSQELPGPYGLKLDTHGHELPVLAGSTIVLANCQLLVIEAYNFTLLPGSPRFHALAAWLEERGFRCCDIADPMRRPGDGVFWQVDLAFAPKDSPIFASSQFAASPGE